MNRSSLYADYQNETNREMAVVILTAVAERNFKNDK